MEMWKLEVHGIPPPPPTSSMHTTILRYVPEDCLSLCVQICPTGLPRPLCSELGVFAMRLCEESGWVASRPCRRKEGGRDSLL